MTDKPRNPNAALAYTGLGFSFAGIVGVMTYLGYWGDQKLGTEPWLLVLCGLSGVSIAIWDLLRTVTALERKDRTEE